MSYDGPQNQPPADKERLPRIPVDRYALTGVIGAGGMGTVLKARHSQLNKMVAIKVLNLQMLQDNDSRVRFEIEAKAGGQLSHPNLIAVFDYGHTLDGEPFFVMEYVDGDSLSDLLEKQTRLNTHEFLLIFGQILKAVNYIHKNNVIHRDIKSSNIMVQTIEDDKYVKLLDFGIAKVLADSGVTMQKLTATGAAMGSPLYMSPEQCLGKHVDARADIYSLGCVMYECFAGYPPYRGTNALQTIQMHLNATPGLLSEICRSESELAISSLIHKCILKDPEHRYQSATELIADLEAIAGKTTQTMQQIAQPQRTTQTGMNRWRQGRPTGEGPTPVGKGGATESSGLSQTLRNQPQEQRPDATRGAGLGQTFRPPGGGMGQAFGNQTAGGMGQTFGTQPAGGMGQTFATPGHGGHPGGGQPAGGNPQAGGAGSNLKDGNAEALWYTYNVAGQQAMAARNHLDAERQFVQAVELAESFGNSDARLSQSLNNLANCLKIQGKHAVAEQYYQRALLVKELEVGPFHKDLVIILENYANLLKVLKRNKEARKIERRAHKILGL